MDPTIALAAIICRLLDAGRAADRRVRALNLQEATDAFEGLTSWIERGGFSPDAKDACARVKSYLDSLRHVDPRQGGLF